MVENAALDHRLGKHQGERIQGIIPVMLTPFHDDGNVDYEGLDRLTDWYLANGADALFAVCQSSEMQFLSIEEKSLSRSVSSAELQVVFRIMASELHRRKRGRSA